MFFHISVFIQGYGHQIRSQSQNLHFVLSLFATSCLGSFIFHEIFAQSLASIDPFEGLADQDIRTAIYNANGTRPSLFVPEMSFDLLVRKQIAKLEQVKYLEMCNGLQRIYFRPSTLEFRKGVL